MKHLFTLFGAFALSLSSLVFAQGTFQENTHYTDVAPDVAASNLEKTVTGFFWYGCPHCYVFEPTLEQWVKNKTGAISFNRTPAILGRSWLPHAQAFYAAEQLGISDKVHEPLFRAIHQDRLALHSPEELAEFIAELSGREPAEILVTMNNSSSRASIEAAIKTAQKYRLRGVPAVLVGGKYLIDPGAVGENFPALVDYLLAK